MQTHKSSCSETKNSVVMLSSVAIIFSSEKTQLMSAMLSFGYYFGHRHRFCSCLYALLFFLLYLKADFAVFEKGVP